MRERTRACRHLPAVNCLPPPTERTATRARAAQAAAELSQPPASAESEPAAAEPEPPYNPEHPVQTPERRPSQQLPSRAVLSERKPPKPAESVSV